MIMFASHRSTRHATTLAELCPPAGGMLRAVLIFFIHFPVYMLVSFLLHLTKLVSSWTDTVFFRMTHAILPKVCLLVSTVLAFCW